MCRLISGKRIAAICDLADSREIDISKHLDAGFLREFDEKHRDYLPGYATDCVYRYNPSSGNPLNIFIHGKTFIVHVHGSSAYFIGNIRGNTVYLYDHKESAHFRYKIAGCVVEEKKVV